MKNFSRGLLFLGILTLALQVHAGTRVSVNFGFGFPIGHCGPVYDPCRPRYSHCGPYYRSYSSYSSYGCSPRYAYYEPTRVVVVRQSPPVEVVEAPPVVQSERRVGYFELGHDWAKDLRQDIATWDQFIDYLRANVAKNSTQNYNEFRQGFISAYGVNAESAFDKAFQQARSDFSTRKGVM
jgi:hypothetical protein